MAARRIKASPTHLLCQGIYYMNLSDELKPAVVYTTEKDQEPSMSEPHMEADSFQPSLQWRLILHAWARYSS